MKYVVLGRYTEQGLAGFVKNPKDNRMKQQRKSQKLLVEN